MKGRIINWGKMNWDSLEHRRALKAKLQEFLTKPVSPEFRDALAKAQEFGTSADFPTSVLDVFKKFQLTDNYDTSYEEIFDMIDISSSQRNGIEILDVEDALVFNKVLEGEKAKVYQMSGSKVQVTCDMYGGGLSWSRRLIDDQEYWALENNAVAFRNKYYSNKSASFYALIEALGAAQNIAWQAPVPAALGVDDAVYTANRDIQTLNLAAQTILLNSEGKGYGITPQNASFKVLAPIQLQTRLRMALGLNLQHFAQSPAFVNYNFQLITTTMLGAADVYYVILPKQKLVGLNRMDLTIYSDFDILSYSDVAVAWGRYGGAIGDQEQLQRCATA
jgi:hypothetical protein